MKRASKLSIIAVMSVLLFASCEKSYLDTFPTDQISEKNALSTIDNLGTALSGVNSLMYTYWYSQGYVGEANMNIVRDLLGEDLINSGTAIGWFNGETQWIYHRQETSSGCYYPYFFYNQIILNVNAILQKIDKVSGNNDVKAQIKGECLAFRGWARFQMVQLYGKRYAAGQDNSTLGLVLRDSTTVTPKARATVEETYAAINKDLDEAIQNMEVSAQTATNRFNIASLYGVKARVSLVQGNWANAESFTDKAIAKASKAKLQTGTSLLTGMNSIEKNSEWMWSYQQSSSQDLDFGSFFAYMSWNFSSTSIRANPKLINSKLYAKIDPNDVRINWWDPTGKKWKKPTTSFWSRPYEHHKFEAAGPANSSGNFCLMRLAEMYLIKAEAQARQTKNAEAQQTLFDLMTTRNPSYVKSEKTGDELLEEILINRRIELWGEGFRFTDLKRMNLPLDRTGANTIEAVSQKMSVPAGDITWEYLIPKKEIDANPLAKQNPL